MFCPSCSFTPPPPPPPPPPQIDNGGGQAAAGGGKILFIEFSEWAIKKNLLKNVHDDDE